MGKIINKLTSCSTFGKYLFFFSKSCLVLSEPGKWYLKVRLICCLWWPQFGIIWKRWASSLACSLTPTDDGVESTRLVLDTGEDIRHLGHCRLDVLLSHCLVLDWTCCHLQLQLQLLDILTTVRYYRNFQFPARTITQAWPGHLVQH